MRKRWLLPLLIFLLLSPGAFAGDQNAGDSSREGDQSSKGDEAGQLPTTEAQREALRKQSQQLKKAQDTIKEQGKLLQESQQRYEQARDGAYASIGRAAQGDLEQLPELEKRLGRDHPIVLAKYTTVAYNYLFSKQYKQADSLFTWLVTAREKTSGPKSNETGRALLNLAETKRFEGLKAEAKPLYERSIKILSTTQSIVPGMDAGTLRQAENGLKLVE
jgi:hypothetical protein